MSTRDKHCVVVTHRGPHDCDTYDAPGNAHCIVGPGPSQSSPAGAPGNGRAERYRAVSLRSVAL